MVASRRSPNAKPNPQLRELEPVAGEGNLAWLERDAKRGADGIILLGGTSLADFRIRYAQSPLRNDLSPSLWSRCGILLSGGVFAGAPLDIPDVAASPARNGVQHSRLRDFDDPTRFPNIAVIRFAKKHDSLLRDIARVTSDRSLIDLSAMILPWLSYVWGTADAVNPLSKGTGLPDAAFIETVFAMAGFELTPGLSSASSCPEAIWQSAKWWTDFYESVAKDREEAISRLAAAGTAAKGRGASAGTMQTLHAAVPMVPTGSFTIRQRAAAVMDTPVSAGRGRRQK
jgi:hypothetical protein